MPLRRSATRTSWADSYTFAKTERPSLVSATRPHRAEASKAAPPVAVVSKDPAASVDLPEEHPAAAAAEAGRSTLPTFVPFSSE
jgi:hypothetical protein